MIKDIANHMLTLGDNVIIIGRMYKPLESEGIIIGLKELIDPDTGKITQKVKVETVGTDKNGYCDVRKSWFNAKSLVKKERDFH